MKQQINETQRLQQLAGILNENKEVEEGIGSAIGKAALGAALTFGSPKDTVAQEPQGIEQPAQVKLSNAEAGDKLWHAYSEHRSTVNASGLSPAVIDALAKASEEADQSGYPYSSIERLGKVAKKDPAAMEIVNTSEASLRASSKNVIDAAKERGYGDSLEETVDESQLNEASWMEWWNMLHPALIIGGSALGVVKLLMKDTKEAIKADLKKQGKEIPNEKILDQLANKLIKGGLDKATGAGEGNMEEGNIEQVVNEALSTYRKKKLKEANEQTDPVAEKDAEQGLKQALSVLQSGENSIQPSTQDGQVDEAVGLALGLVAGAPGLISLLGKGVNAISGVFQKDKKQGTTVGNALKKWGHQLEETYLSVIGNILIKSFPKTFKGQNVKDHNSNLYKTAHGVYAAMLAAAAISSGLGAAQAHSTVAAGLEGGLTAFKTSEVVSLAQKIAAV